MDFNDVWCKLEPKLFEYNETKLFWYKLYQNAFLGKLAQKEFKSQTQFCIDNFEVQELWFSEEVDIIETFAIGETHLRVDTLPKKDYFRPSRRYLPHLNASITSKARVELGNNSLKHFN